MAGLILSVLIVLLRAERAPDPPQLRPAEGLVTFVYDGDTVEVSGVGKVRLIGVDCMDGHNERRAADQADLYGMAPDRVRHWAGQATEFARQELSGKSVALQFGPERTDAYGRTLGYAHIAAGEGEGRDFNRLLLEQGLAAAYRRFRHPRLDDYLAAEREARRAGRGMWQDAQKGP